VLVVNRAASRAKVPRAAWPFALSIFERRAPGRGVRFRSVLLQAAGAAVGTDTLECLVFRA
jgi:hypothetical protein